MSVKNCFRYLPSTNLLQKTLYCFMLFIIPRRFYNINVGIIHNYVTIFLRLRHKIIELCSSNTYSRDHNDYKKFTCTLCSVHTNRGSVEVK